MASEAWYQVFPCCVEGFPAPYHESQQSPSRPFLHLCERRGRVCLLSCLRRSPWHLRQIFQGLQLAQESHCSQEPKAPFPAMKPINLHQSTSLTHSSDHALDCEQPHRKDRLQETAWHHFARSDTHPQRVLHTHPKNMHSSTARDGKTLETKIHPL